MPSVSTVCLALAGLVLTAGCSSATPELTVVPDAAEQIRAEVWTQVVLPLSAPKPDNGIQRTILGTVQAQNAAKAKTGAHLGSKALYGASATSFYTGIAPGVTIRVAWQNRDSFCLAAHADGGTGRVFWDSRVADGAPGVDCTTDFTDASGGPTFRALPPEQDKQIPDAFQDAPLEDFLNTVLPIRAVATVSAVVAADRLPENVRKGKDGVALLAEVGLPSDAARIVTSVVQNGKQVCVKITSQDLSGIAFYSDPNAFVQAGQPRSSALLYRSVVRTGSGDEGSDKACGTSPLTLSPAGERGLRSMDAQVAGQAAIAVNELVPATVTVPVVPSVSPKAALIMYQPNTATKS